MAFKQFQKIIAAAYTPFSTDGSLNLDLIAKQSSYYQKNSLHGIFLGGTNGEGKLLTLEERKRLTETWIQHKGSLQIYVHVGTEALHDAQSLSEHAQQHGADAIAALGPVFYKPKSLSLLVEYCAEIAREASTLPFYYYHIPTMTGLNYPMIDFLKVASEKIPNLRGMKYSHDNMMDIQQCQNFDQGQYEVLFGRDEMLLSALAVGVNGAVGSTYNFAVPLYHKLIHAFESGDLQTARQWQACSHYLVNQFKRCENEVAVGKTMLKILGVDCGPVRLPLQNLTHEQQTELHEKLKQANAFDYLNQSAD